MKFCIQDPKCLDSVLLHEELSSAFDKALYGGGAYAFVTESGLRILIGSENFESFMKNGKFKLIVGTDDITGIRELDKLESYVQIYGKDHFDVKAFYNTEKTTFHPKFAWFKTKVGGLVIVGSGNLTLQGLRKNREAFTVTEVSDDEIKLIENQWNNWLKSNKENLKELDDEVIRDTLELNAKKSKEYRKLRFKLLKSFANEISSTEQIEEIVQLNSEELDNIDTWSFDLSAECLIAEVPKNGSRLKQVNFDKESFENYFGAVAGNNDYRILLRNITSDGELADIENRPSVSVASQNYRFELDAIAGYNYPIDGKPPLLVFVKVETRTFIYEFLMPNNSNYDTLKEYLDILQQPNKRKLRRVTISVDDLLSNCHNLNLWNYLMRIEEV